MRLTQKRLRLLIDAAGRGIDQMVSDGEITDAQEEEMLLALDALHALLRRREKSTE